MSRYFPLTALLGLSLVVASIPAQAEETPAPQTTVAIDGTRWLINGHVTYPGAKAEGQAELIELARREYPKLLISTSGLGSGCLPRPVAEAADFLLPHFNDTTLDNIPARIEALKQHGKPIVCNEDDRTG